jgi:hypothetical protein
MKLFGSNRYDVMTERCVSFGSSSFLRSESTKHLTPYHWCAIKISLGTMTQIIGPIGIIWNCLAVTDMVSWLKDVWFLAQAWGQGVPNFWHYTTAGPPTPHWTPWHHNHWSHRHDMNLFGSNRYGVMTERCVSFDSSLRSGSTKLLSPYHWCAIKTSLDTMTPIIGPIGMT